MIHAKVIKTHSPLNVKVFRDELRNAAKEIADAAKKDFEKTTATWKHKPTFTEKITETGNKTTADVTTKDKIYRYVDEGTRPHIIRPLRARSLAFRSGYKAKTRPHVLSSRNGGASGAQVFAQIVRHPGTDPRYFSVDIQAKYQPKLATAVQKAIDRAARKSGHYINK